MKKHIVEKKDINNGTTEQLGVFETFTQAFDFLQTIPERDWLYIFSIYEYPVKKLY